MLIITLKITLTNIIKTIESNNAATAGTAAGSFVKDLHVWDITRHNASDISDDGKNTNIITVAPPTAPRHIIIPM